MRSIQDDTASISDRLQKIDPIPPLKKEKDEYIGKMIITDMPVGGSVDFMEVIRFNGVNSGRSRDVFSHKSYKFEPKPIQNNLMPIKFYSIVVGFEDDRNASRNWGINRSDFKGRVRLPFHFVKKQIIKILIWLLKSL